MNRDHIAIAVLVAVYLGLGTHAVIADRFLHDEGILTWIFARVTAAEPIATTFWQKSRPPLSAIYAPISVAGFDVFSFAHLAVAASGIVFLHGAARRLGHARPAVAAAILAFSPLYLGGGPAGINNVDAVVGLCAALWLWTAGHRRGALFVVGALVWVRSELAVLALIVAVVALWARRPRWLAALAGFPIVYGLAGAAYHGNLLWMLHYPPALSVGIADNPVWASHQARLDGASIMGLAGALTPAIPLVAAASWQRLAPVERLGVVFATALVTALWLLPVWQVFNFDYAPRYLLPALPVVALAIGRGTETWTDAAVMPGLLIALGLALWAGRAEALAIVAAAALALAFCRAGKPRVAWATLGATVALGPAAFEDATHLRRMQQAPHLGPMVARLGEHAEVLQRQPVFTNEPLLATYLRRSDLLPGVRVLYLVGADQDLEMRALTNPTNGQRAALRATLRATLYGTAVFPEELTPDAVPTGALFALRDDGRLPQVLDPRRWDAALVVIHPGDRFRIARRVASGVSP